jgi:hypothetical protein
MDRKKVLYVRCKDFTAASMKTSLFWDAAPQCLVEIARCMRVVYCDNFSDDGDSKLLYKHR